MLILSGSYVYISGDRSAHLRDRFVEGESGICKIFPYAKPHGNDGERGGRTDLAHEWHI